MATKKLAVVPIYWGSKWLPASTAAQKVAEIEARTLLGREQINWINLNAAMWTIMRSWYMLGFAEYGIEPGMVHPGYVLRDAEDQPPPTFDANLCWFKINDVIAGGLVPAPDAWGDDYKVLYCLFLQPRSENTDRSVFGQNDKNAVHAWVTANSDFPGVVETYAHEMVEASTGQEIADPCQRNTPATVMIDGLRLPLFFSNQLNTCWPTQQAIAAQRAFVLQAISQPPSRARRAPI